VAYSKALDLRQIATPADPPANVTLLYSKSDGLLYRKVGSVESPVDTTGGGGTTIPVGTITMFGGSSAPSGWALCDGSTVLRSSALGQVIGTTYGVGDGSTTCNLPDLRSRFPVGAGSFAALGGQEGFPPAQESSRGARMNHQHSHDVSGTTAGEPQDHVHGVVIGVATNTTASGGATRVTTVNGSGTASGTFNSNGRSATHTHTWSDTSTSNGVGGDFQYHPYQAINFIIKT